MMSVRDMVDELALRVVDADKSKFPDKFKWELLNIAQFYVVNMLHPDYLTELRYSDSNETVTSGACALSNLAYKPLRGEPGIINVKVYNGLYCNLLGLSDLKKEENTYLDGKTTFPLAWMFANAIRLLPTSIAHIDVDYLRVPLPLMHPFTITATDPAAQTTFVVDTNQNISATNDIYNHTLVYLHGLGAYRTLADYVGSTRTVTTDQNRDDASGTYADTDGPMYFIPNPLNDFHLTNLENVYCTLDASLHNIVVDIAEALCWKVPGNNERVKVALENALEQIKALNEKYRAPEGIGSN